MSALLESLETDPCFAGLDELRATEYGRLDATDAVYLDYTGGSLYAESQVTEHLRMLSDGVYGNPHSANPTSSSATALVERARAAVLSFFNAPESEYACIFTPNATGAIRLVGANAVQSRSTSQPRSWARSIHSSGCLTPEKLDCAG